MISVNAYSASPSARGIPISSAMSPEGQPSRDVPDEVAFATVADVVDDAVAQADHTLGQGGDIASAEGCPDQLLEPVVLGRVHGEHQSPCGRR